VIVGFGIGIALYLHKYITDKHLSSVNILGIVGLVLQTIISLFAENPKMYFIYPIISSCIYTLAFGVSILLKKDIISILAKNMTKGEEIFELLKPTYRKLTIMWFGFFAFKTVVKLLGVSQLSFEILYSINWVLGTPVTMALMWFSYWYPQKALERMRLGKVIS